MTENALFPNVQRLPWGSIAWLIEPDQSGLGRVSIGILTFEPRSDEGEHVHSREEHLIYTISGSGYHVVNGIYARLQAGDYSYLPPHSRHEIVNDSDAPLKLLAVYVPTRIHPLREIPGKVPDAKPQTGQQTDSRPSELRPQNAAPDAERKSSPLDNPEAVASLKALANALLNEEAPRRAAQGEDAKAGESIFTAGTQPQTAGNYSACAIGQTWPLNSGMLEQALRTAHTGGSALAAGRAGAPETPAPLLGAYDSAVRALRGRAVKKKSPPAGQGGTNAADNQTGRANGKDSPQLPDFDVQTLVPVLQRLSQALSLSLTLLDTQGTFLHTTQNRPKFCRLLAEGVGEQHCRRHVLSIFGKIVDGGRPQLFRCCGEVSSIIIPVSHKGIIYAYLKCGEIFLSSDDREALLLQLPELAPPHNLTGILERLPEAVKEIPIVPKGRLHSAAEALLSIADTLVEMVDANYRRKEMNELRFSLMREQLETARQEKALREYSLKLLQSQVNPHFLFNTLNTVAQLAYVEGAHQATKLICSLSELLRYTLRKTEHLIPLREEMSLLNNYIAIQRQRFGSRITFDVAPLPSSLNEVLVPCMLFQPLVENSILHGLYGRNGHGLIKVGIRRRKGRVQAVVSDDGVGFDPEQLPSGEDRIGLNSTRGRLRHHFGEDCDFRLESAPGKGASVYIEFPA